MASVLLLCLTLCQTYIIPSKCSATISSQKLAQDIEMILRAVRILVTVISVTYWQQCLSGYTDDNPQFPFTEPDSSSGYTNQVSFLCDSGTVTSISHIPFQIIFLETCNGNLHAFLNTALKAQFVQ
jgi:hypothetical protein